MHQIKPHILKTIEMLPLVIPAALASFAIPIIILLLLNSFKILYVLPAGLLAAGLSSYVVYKYGSVERPGSLKEQRICDVLILIAVMAWVGVNLPFASQHIFTNRDPAIYTNAGMWLIENESLRIEKPTIFEGLNENKVSSESAGFVNDPQNNSILLAQGAHLLPGFLSLGGKAFGVPAMLHLNIFFGGTAILAVYGAGRLLVKPGWAVVASVATACSLPLIYFSRGTYTEPLAATFTFGALSMIYVAMKTHRHSMWFLAGIVTGAGALSRIDAYLTVVALAAFISLLLITTQKRRRKKAVKQLGFFVLGVTLAAATAWLDLIMLSTGYYEDHLSQFSAMMQALGGVILLGLAATVLTWKTNLLKRVNHEMMKRIALISSMLVILIGVVLISQPLWRVSYSNGVNEYVLGLQKAQGLLSSTETGARLATRNFSEYAAHWAVWYIGPLVALLSLIGASLLTWRVTRYKEMLSAPLLFVVGGTALVYFIKPSIAPDQIWAARRLLPVILPGMSILAVITLSKLWHASKLKTFNIDGKIIATVIATLAVISPLIVSAPFSLLRERDTHLSAVQETCRFLPENAAVLWLGAARNELVQPTRHICGAPSAGHGAIFAKKAAPPNRTMLQGYATHVKERGHVPVVAVFGREGELLSLGEGNRLTKVHSSVWREMEHTLLRPPHVTNNIKLSIHMGLVEPDGKVVELNKTGQ